MTLTVECEDGKYGISHTVFDDDEDTYSKEDAAENLELLRDYLLSGYGLSVDIKENSHYTDDVQEVLDSIARDVTRDREEIDSLKEEEDEWV